MTRYKTLARGTAVAKLQFARRVVYSFQRKGGASYQREVPPDELARAFPGNPDMRLRIRLSDSRHEVIVRNRDAKIRYDVEF
jgi:hypothetical protein